MYATYREQVPSYKHLDDPLDEGRLVFECILAGNLQAFTTCRLSSHVQETVLCISLARNSVSCYKINCSFLVTLTQRVYLIYGRDYGMDYGMD